MTGGAILVGLSVAQRRSRCGWWLDRDQALLLLHLGGRTPRKQRDSEAQWVLHPELGRVAVQQQERAPARRGGKHATPEEWRRPVVVLAPRPRHEDGASSVGSPCSEGHPGAVK